MTVTVLNRLASQSEVHLVRRPVEAVSLIFARLDYAQHRQAAHRSPCPLVAVSVYRVFRMREDLEDLVVEVMDVWRLDSKDSMCCIWDFDLYSECILLDYSSPSVALG